MTQVTELEALQQQRQALDAEIKAKESAARAEALQGLKDLINQFNFSAAELGFRGAREGKGKTSSGKGKVAPKYVNPEDSTQTWTGRGRAPLWVVAYRAAHDGTLDGTLVGTKA